MNEVAIISYITHSSHFNYGATLHGWAFAQVLRSMGAEPVIIDYLPKSLEGHHFKWPVVDALRSWRNPFLLARRVAQWLVSTRANLRKFAKFEAFKRERLGRVTRLYTERSLAAAERLDGCDPAVFVCESDVIWKFSAKNGFDRGFLLDFPAARGKRKVAYAPSVGKGLVPVEEERRFTSLVSSFAAISSRERAGAAYLSRLTSRVVPWLVDPVLLLDAEDYLKILKPSGWLTQGGYVLLYTCMNMNANMVREAKRFAKRLGKPLIEVGNYGIDRYIYGHETVDDAGVEEWLGLFAGAAAVVCNSFHGICFSLVFEKPFFAFKRKEDDWRFTGICEEFATSDRLVERDGKIPENAPEIDFLEIRSRLAVHRKRALEFIRREIASPARCANDAPQGSGGMKGVAE